MNETTAIAAADVRVGAPPSAMIAALAAPGSAPAYAEKLAIFGQMVGTWDTDDTYLAIDGTVTKRQRAEWLFDWVLNGRAIQDVLITSPRDAQRETGVPFGEYGTTLRFYDPKLGAWQVTFVAPVYGIIVKLVAKPDGTGNGIILKGCAPSGASDEGQRYRWIFTEITLDSFRWRGYWSADEDQTWHQDEEMVARRRAG